MMHKPCFFSSKRLSRDLVVLGVSLPLQEGVASLEQLPGVNHAATNLVFRSHIEFSSWHSFDI